MTMILILILAIIFSNSAFGQQKFTSADSVYHFRGDRDATPDDPAAKFSIEDSFFVFIDTTRMSVPIQMIGTAAPTVIPIGRGWLYMSSVDSLLYWLNGTGTASNLTAGAAGGEINTFSSLGGTETIIGTKTGVDLPHKGFTAGINITLSSTANAITINSTGGSQTPWTANIDADGFDLQDLSNIEFRTTTGAPASSVQSIWADAGGINLNVPTADIFDIQVNGVSQLTISATVVNAVTSLTEAGNAIFNSSETPGGELGGTWASPTIDDGVTVTNWALGTPASMVGTNLSGTGASFTAGVSTLATVTDNESTAEENPVVFVAGADPDGGTLGLETDGTMTYNPSTGTLTTTEFVGGGVGITGVTAAHVGTITWTGTSILETGVAFQFGDASDATLTHTYANTGTNVSVAYSSALFTFSHGLTLSAGDITQAAGTTLFMGGLLDATGAVDMDYGSVDITDHTFIADGTTDSDFVVPLTSISGAEIVNDTITPTQLDETAIYTWSGANLLTGIHEVADDIDFNFGTDADWSVQYDEGVDNQLLFETTATAAVAITDPMFEILVGTTPTANQEIFGVAKGTQATNTPLFIVDEDGDGVFAGTIDAGGAITAVGSFIIGSADMSESDLEKLDGITNGAGAANKALVLDASADIVSGLANLTASATITVPTVLAGLLDPAGAVDLDLGSADITDVTVTTDGGTAILDGSISTSQGATASGLLIILEDTDAGTNFASFQVPALASNTAYILPPAFGTAGFQLTDAAGDGILSWAAVGSGTGAFSDAADPVVLNTITKDVHMGDGAGTLVGKVEIGGDADQPQLVLEGFSIQTDDIFIIQNDADTEVFTVSNTGVLTAAAASATVASIVELATAAETTTGTDATRALTPDGFAGSDHGIRNVEILVTVDFDTDTAVGNGKAYFVVPTEWGGMNLVSVHAEVITTGTTNTTDLQIHNLTQAADMLSTVITIDSGEGGSNTAATPPVIDTANDDIADFDVLRFDIDAVSTTAAKGLLLVMGFQVP